MSGNAYANGPETTLSQSGNYTQYVTYDGTLTYGTEITGTWWAYSGGTYHNWGTVCGTFN